jgi:orotate phosphoribosyltransferase
VTDAAEVEGQVRDLLRRSGALREGHFVLSSGRHSSGYVQCALLLEDAARARQLGRWLADRLREFEPESVLSPALGGLIIGHETAAALEVPFRFTERKQGVMELRRGFRLRREERVAVVEDVVTTGGSSGEAAAVAVALGATWAATGAIIDRSGGDSPFAVPFESLLKLELPTWTPEECPLCAEGTPVEKPGSRGA